MSNVLLSLLFAVAYTTLSFKYFLEHDFGWMAFCLIFAIFYSNLAFEKTKQSRKSRQKQQLEHERLEAIFQMINEVGAGCTSYAFFAVIEGTMTLENLKEVLKNRYDAMFPDVKTECRYFSKSRVLKCAVNPAVSCDTCQYFEER